MQITHTHLHIYTYTSIRTQNKSIKHYGNSGLITETILTKIRWLITLPGPRGSAQPSPPPPLILAGKEIKQEGKGRRVHLSLLSQRHLTHCILGSGYRVFHHRQKACDGFSLHWNSLGTEGWDKGAASLDICSYSRWELRALAEKVIISSGNSVLQPLLNPFVTYGRVCSEKCIVRSMSLGHLSPSCRHWAYLLYDTTRSFSLMDHCVCLTVSKWNVGGVGQCFWCWKDREPQQPPSNTFLSPLSGMISV